MVEQLREYEEDAKMSDGKGLRGDSISYSQDTNNNNNNQHRKYEPSLTNDAQYQAAAAATSKRDNAILNENLEIIKLSGRRFELFIKSILNDIQFYYTDDLSPTNRNVKIRIQLLPIEIMSITQYIRTMIYEYHVHILNSDENKSNDNMNSHGGGSDGHDSDVSLSDEDDNDSDREPSMLGGYLPTDDGTGGLLVTPGGPDDGRFGGGNNGKGGNGNGNNNNSSNGRGNGQGGHNKKKSQKINIPKIDEQYSGLLCCNLLSVIENEYVHECVLDYHEANTSNFRVFVDTIQENSNELCNVQTNYERLKRENENLEIEYKQIEVQLHHISANVLADTGNIAKILTANRASKQHGIDKTNKNINFTSKSMQQPRVLKTIAESGPNTPMQSIVITKTDESANDLNGGSGGNGNSGDPADPNNRNSLVPSTDGANVAKGGAQTERRAHGALPSKGNMTNLIMDHNNMQHEQNLSIMSARSSAAPMVPFLPTRDSFADVFEQTQLSVGGIKMAVPALLKYESGDWNDMDNAGLVSPRAAQGQFQQAQGPGQGLTQEQLAQLQAQQRQALAEAIAQQQNGQTQGQESGKPRMNFDVDQEVDLQAQPQKGQGQVQQQPVGVANNGKEESEMSSNNMNGNSSNVASPVRSDDPNTPVMDSPQGSGSVPHGMPASESQVMNMNVNQSQKIHIVNVNGNSKAEVDSSQQNLNGNNNQPATPEVERQGSGSASASVSLHKTPAKASMTAAVTAVGGKVGGVRQYDPQHPGHIKWKHSLTQPVKLDSMNKKDFFSKYLIESKTVGQGSFAKVHRCKRKSDGIILAMKVIRKKGLKSSELQSFRREISILSQVGGVGWILVFFCFVLSRDLCHKRATCQQVNNGVVCIL